MAKIFISYRRVDTPYVASVLCERLQQLFGREAIFYDEDTIPLGIDFRTFLDESVSRCEVLLALIGDRWEAERLHDPKDFVRIELEAALRREIPVIPVLIRGAEVPTEASLPNSLKDFSYRNGTRLRSGRDLFYDLERLVQGIERVANLGVRQKISTQSSPSPKHTAFLQELGIEMVRVEGGSFKLGGKVPCTLSAFQIGKFPITQAQWEKLMGTNPSHFKGCGDCPVERVSWKDAQKFIEKLNAGTGKKFSLPTEAQWEFAARGGTKSKGYEYAGSNELEEVGWYWKNSGDRPLDGKWDWKRIEKNNCRTHPVGQKTPNELGLYDMSGNVWEWCQDWYGDYPAGPLKDPQGPESGQNRVLRGGSWDRIASYCRVSDRSGNVPAYRDNAIGFRLAGDGS